MDIIKHRRSFHTEMVSLRSVALLLSGFPRSSGGRLVRALIIACFAGVQIPRPPPSVRLGFAPPCPFADRERGRERGKSQNFNFPLLGRTDDAAIAASPLPSLPPFAPRVAVGREDLFPP